MTHDGSQSEPLYDKPVLDVLGGFAVDTLSFNPDKWSSFSDLAQGINNAVNNGGIGS